MERCLGNLWFLNYYDLWRYNPITNNWAWIGGNTISNYGTKCIPDLQDEIGSRSENRATWIDQYGNFWTFGGLRTSYSLGWNDLWMYCISTNQWTWASGENVVDTIGNWGTLGVSSPTNKPRGRGGAVGWTNGNGHLYLFWGTDNYNLTHLFNDLWVYTIDSACLGGCYSINNVDENYLIKSLFISPNPFTTELEIRCTEKGEIILYDIAGKEVLKQQIWEGGIKLNTENISSGFYLLHFTDGKRSANFKVMKL